MQYTEIEQKFKEKIIKYNKMDLSDYYFNYFIYKFRL